MKSNRTKILNIVGLGLGMLGVLIIFFYGPPQPSFFPYDIITDDNLHKEVLEMKERYELFSKIGLGFIFIGFLLQLLTVCFSSRLNKTTENLKEETKTTSTASAEGSTKI